MSPRRPHPLVMLLLIAATAASLSASVSGQDFVTKVLAGSGAAGDDFGSSVAISGDTAVVGARWDDTHGASTGAAYVYVRTNGDWVEQQKLTATPPTIGALFGYSVAIDGDTIVVGASGTGSAFVFLRSGNVWSQQQELVSMTSHGWAVAVDGDTAVSGGNEVAAVFVRAGSVWTEQQLVIAPDGMANDNFGESLDLEGDTMIVGAEHDNDDGTNSGSAYVFVRGGATWTLEQKLTASDALPFDEFGKGVGISGDSVVVGAPHDNGFDDGAAYVFTRSLGIWSEQQILTTSEPKPIDAESVSIEGDTIIVASRLDDDNGMNSGAVFLFTRSGAIWTEVRKLSAQEGQAQDRFGTSVDVEGSLLVVGAPRDDDNGVDSGSAYLYDLSVDEHKLSPSDGDVDDRFGEAVAVDGDIAVVGARLDDDNGIDSGSAYVYVRSGDIWDEEAKLTPSDGAPGDEFGFSVAVDGDTAVVGSRYSSFNTGAVYVFERSGAVWSEQQKLTASDAGSGDWFGTSLAIEGDTLVVGTPGDDDNGTNAGAAYVFVRSGGTWTEQQKLIASDGFNVDLMGWSVGICGETAVVSAHGDDDNGSGSGSAYVFVRSATAWSELQKLTASDGESSDSFARSVAIDAGTLVLGAPGDDDSGADSGAGYLFVRAAGVWTEQQKVHASNGVAGDDFGYGVAISNGIAIVGAPENDDLGSNAGSASLFTQQGGIWIEKPFAAFDAAGGDFFGRHVAIDDGTVVVGSGWDTVHGSNSGSAYVFGFSPLAPEPFPGTDEDLVMESLVNGAGTPGIPDKQAAVGDTLVVGFYSPGGAFDGTLPLLLGQAFQCRPTAAYPGIAIDPFIVPGPVVFFDGNVPGSPLGPFYLPPGGFSFAATIPAPLAGWSVLFQAYVFANTASNGIFASTTGHSIGVL